MDDEPTFLTSTDIDNFFAKIMNGDFDSKMIPCWTCGKQHFPSYGSLVYECDECWFKRFPEEDVKEFYIATDNDEKGDKVAEQVVQRLGRWRCKRVTFKGKDANEDLISGVLEETAYNAKEYPVSGTFTTFDLHDKIVELYNNGLPPTFFPKHSCFGNLKDIFSVMLGHLIVGTGIPSHGKSNFTEWYIMNLIHDYQMKASFFSPEHTPMEQHQASFIEKFIGKPFNQGFSERVSLVDIAEYVEWGNEKLYLTSPETGLATWDWIFERFKEQMYRYGINIFVIDAWNKVDMPEGLHAINKTLARLTQFAQQNNVMIFLIAHPTKMQKDKETGLYDIPDLYSVSGSADFRNQTHDGFCIYRYFGENPRTSFTNLKTKMKFQGEMGKSVDFQYHPPSGRYYAVGTPIPTHKLTDISLRERDAKAEGKELPKPMPNDAFTPYTPPEENAFEFGSHFNPEEDIPF